jgi:hypothetical protein
MKKIVSALLPLLFIPALVSAQTFTPWYEYLNIPQEFTTFPNLLYFVFIPFLGTFTIIWGILTNLRIFSVNRVNILLSFIFAIALLYSTALTTLTFYLFQAGGVFGVIAFFILFFALTTLFTSRRLGVSYEDTRRAYKDIEVAAGRELKDSLKYTKDLRSLGNKIHYLDKLIIKTRGDLAKVILEAERARSIEQRIMTMGEKLARQKYGRSKQNLIEHYKRLELIALRHKKLLTSQLMKYSLQRDKLKQLQLKINQKL